MADPKPDLSLPRQEAGALFKLEMATTSFLLGYWKHMIGAVLLVLLGILVYGQYTNAVRRSQRDMTSQIAAAWAEIPPEAVPGQLTDAQETEIRDIADQLAGLGATFRGASAAEAYLKSAELYRVLGDTEAQRTSLEAAVPFAKGPLLYAAKSGLANLDIEAGNTEAAITTLRSLMDTLDGYLAEQAALSLGQVYEHEGRDSDARSVYVEFQTRWPNSPRLTEVSDRLAILDAEATDLPAPGLAPEPIEMPAPIETGPTEPAPTEPAPAPGAP